MQSWCLWYRIIFIFQATDKDLTKIQYAIESGNTIDNAFEIDKDTGLITLKRGIKTEDIKDKSGT